MRERDRMRRKREGKWNEVIKVDNNDTLEGKEPEVRGGEKGGGERREGT